MKSKGAVLESWKHILNFNVIPQSRAQLCPDFCVSLSLCFWFSEFTWNTWKGCLQSGCTPVCNFCTVLFDYFMHTLNLKTKGTTADNLQMFTLPVWTFQFIHVWSALPFFFFLLILQNFSQGLLQWIIPKWDLVLIFMQDFLPDSTNPVYPRWDRHLEDKGPLVAGYDEQRKVCVFPRNASTAPTSCTHYPWLRCDHHRGSLMTWLLQH